MRPENRGISTVVDVAMALFLITASIGVVMAFLDTGGPPPDPQEADQTAETLAVTTMNINYSVANVRNEPLYPNGTSYSGSQYERSRYGATTSMLAKATVAGVSINGTQFTRENRDFEDGVKGGVLESITAMDGKTRVVAIYRLHDNSSVTNRVEAGPTPPPDADVSTTTIEVSSGIPPLNESRVERKFGKSADYDTVGTMIAEKLVEGYFPVSATQIQLEGNNETKATRSLAVYRYRRMERIVQSKDDPEFDHTDSDDPISQHGADAEEANELLVDGLEEVIAADLRESFDDPSKEEFADEVSTGKVTITIQTWKNEEA